ncbi:MAG: cyclodeaminase/cyclohydrolase family protein [Planctomycetes bacterium]|nr:cyclodeaminase/cyclohydrolase family protein [Planctomycetota bacterium]
MFREKTIQEFVTALSAKTPTPGGGTAAAVAGAFGAALGHMVVQFSVGRTDLAPYEGDLVRRGKELDGLSSDLLRLADDDAAAYDAYTAAGKLPRTTPEEKEARRAAREAALRRALEVPLEGMRKALAVLRAVHFLAARSNPHLASDVGVGGLLAFAALRGCRFNVDTNLASLADASGTGPVREEADKLEADAGKLHEDLLARLRPRA